jgi:hypothetical protein
MRWLSCSMAVGCNWMQDCLKPVSLWPDTSFPLQAREFQWGSVSVNGSTNSSSQHCPSMGSWSKRCLISTMGGELIAGRAGFRRSGRRSRPLVLLHRVWAGTVASSLSMGVEPATLDFRKTMQGGKTREIEWAPVKAAPAFLVPEESPPQEYGPWQQAAAFGRAAGRFGADTFLLQEDGTLRCPAGASLWLSEVRQENAFTQRAVYAASQMDCPHCTLREQCLGRNAKGNRARRGSRGPPSLTFSFICRTRSSSSRSDTVGGCSRPSASSHLDRPLAQEVTSKSFPWKKFQKKHPLPLVLLARSVLIIAGVGTLGLHAMPGGDQPFCALLRLSFPLFLLSASVRRNEQVQRSFKKQLHLSEKS